MPLELLLENGNTGYLLLVAMLGVIWWRIDGTRKSTNDKIDKLEKKLDEQIRLTNQDRIDIGVLKSHHPGSVHAGEAHGIQIQSGDF